MLPRVDTSGPARFGVASSPSMRAQLLRCSRWLLAACLFVMPAQASAAQDRVLLAVDRDDDDADGTPDAEQLVVQASPELFSIPRPGAIPAGATFALRGDNVRL